MKALIPDRYRAGLSSKLLDWAEALPRFRGGTIARLQNLREHQREASLQTYEGSRPPKGCSLDYLYFRLFEVFNVEDVDRLVGNLVRLFPEMKEKRQWETFPADVIQRQAERIRGGAWWHLGVITRERKDRIFAGPVHELPSLPPEVDCCRVSLYHVLPSVFVIAFDVVLSEVATKRLAGLQDRKYLPELVLTDLRPWKLYRSGFSQMPEEAVAQRAARQWREQLHRDVEDCLRPFADGYFMRGAGNSRHRLPAIDVYALKGAPVEAEAREEWHKASRHWRYSLGLDRLQYRSYSDGTLVIALGEGEDTFSPGRNDPSHQLIILWEPYLATRGKDVPPDDVRNAVTYYTAEAPLKDLLPILAVLEFLAIAEREVERMRQVVFGSVKPRRLPAIGLGSRIRVNDTILQTSMVIDRLATEFGQADGLFRRNAREVAEFKCVSPLGADEPEDIGTVLSSAAKYRIELLRTHVTFLREWFEQYISLRNVAATYSLALVVVIITILQLVGLGNVQDFLTKTCELIRQLLTR